MSQARVDLFNPSEEHRQLRDNTHRFGETVLDPQAGEHDEKEKGRYGEHPKRDLRSESRSSG